MALTLAGLEQFQDVPLFSKIVRDRPLGARVVVAHSPTAPTEAKRVKGFASFFKSYMSIWTVVVAALPIPVAAFKLIPTFEVQRSYLSVYTSLFCFLSLGFIFFMRHIIAPYFFRSPTKGDLNLAEFCARLLSTTAVGALPLGFILLSIFSVFRYQNTFNDALVIAQAQATGEEQNGQLPSAFLSNIEEGDRRTKLKYARVLLFENRSLLAASSDQKSAGSGELFSFQEAIDRMDTYETDTWGSEREIARRFDLKTHGTGGGSTERNREAMVFLGTGVKVPSSDDVLKRKAVPLSTELMFWYIVIFVAAEAAFILMALKEYLQDLLGLTDSVLIGITSTAPSVQRAERQSELEEVRDTD